MSNLIQGKTTKENLPVKRFGYLISAVFVLLTVTGMMLQWPITPILFLVTMYFLTGALWIPILVRPFYKWFGRYVVKPEPGEEKPTDTFFNPN